MRTIKLKEVRISNYRSIRDEQVLFITDESTLIGPNNAGKTNTLRAISILFGGYENSYNYNRELDIPFDRQSNKTSIIGQFEIDDSETWFWDAIDKLHYLQGTKRDSNQISLYLYFTETNTPVYNFFTNVKRPQDKKADYSRILRSLVSEFVLKFQVVYIPSEKSIDDLYKNLLAPRLSSKAAAILSSAMGDLTDELNSINRSNGVDGLLLLLQHVVMDYSFDDTALTGLVVSPNGSESNTQLRLVTTRCRGWRSKPPTPLDL